MLPLEEQKCPVSDDCKYSHPQLLHGHKATFKKQDGEGREAGASRNVSVTVPVASSVASNPATGTSLRLVKLWVRAVTRKGDIIHRVTALLDGGAP